MLKQFKLLFISCLVGMSSVYSLNLTGHILQRQGSAKTNLAPFASGVEVVLKGDHLSEAIKTVSDSNGVWTFSGLPVLTPPKMNLEYQIVGQRLYFQGELKSLEVFNSKGQLQNRLKTSRQNNQTFVETFTRKS